jgi:hypothetical protein
MNVICVGVKEEGGMKLCNDFSIPIILKAHQILHLELLDYLKNFFHLRLIKVFKVLPVNPLHLSDPRLAQTHRRVKRTTEQRPKSLVNASMLGLRIWIFFPDKFNLNISSFITLIFQLQRAVILGGWPLLEKKRVVH